MRTKSLGVMQNLQQDDSAAEVSPSVPAQSLDELVPDKVEDGASYLEQLEKQKKRAERFGIEVVEVSFPGMVPSHKRYMNAPKDDENQPELPPQLFSQDKQQERLKRFPEANDDSWLRSSFQVLKQTCKRLHDPSFTSIDQLPKENVRIPGVNAVQRPNSLHLYGVDCLETKQIFDFFHAFPPSFIEWLDDSSCNVIFPDQETTNFAFAALGRDCPADLKVLEDNEEAIEDESMQDEDSLSRGQLNQSENAEELELQDIKEQATIDLEKWKAGKLSRAPYTCVMMRYATLDDKRPDFKTRLERYHQKHNTQDRNRHRRKHRHEPYSRGSNRTRQIKAAKQTSDIQASPDTNARAKRFGGVISSIIGQNAPATKADKRE